MCKIKKKMWEQIENIKLISTQIRKEDKPENNHTFV